MNGPKGTIQLLRGNFVCIYVRMCLGKTELTFTLLLPSSNADYNVYMYTFSIYIRLRVETGQGSESLSDGNTPKTHS